MLRADGLTLAAADAVNGLFGIRAAGCPLLAAGVLIAEHPALVPDAEIVRNVHAHGAGHTVAASPAELAAQLGAQGKTSFTETIFENRFLYVQELQKLGAKLSQAGRTVRLQGAEPLHAARPHAGDLRGGAALVLGAMQAEGESTIFGVILIERGYDTLEAALQSVGARLKTVEIPKKM